MAFQDTFKALSDPVRREILFLLKDGRKSAGDIAANFDMTQATVSYHLSVLKKADLVQETRKANFIYYDLNTSVFEDLMLYFAQFKDIASETHAEQTDSDTPVQQGENNDGQK